MQWIASIVGSLIASLLVLIIVFFFERKRLPVLRIHVLEEANADDTYRDPLPQALQGRWKFFRVFVENKALPKLIKWIPRQPAENCRTNIAFFKLGGEFPIFVMRGRWASTPEIAHIPKDEIELRVLHPDPITIPPGEQERLDIVAKHAKDNEAYGWNNDSYVNMWKTPQHRLDPGNYTVKIDISTQNGVSFAQKCRLQISDRIDDTHLKE